MTDNLGTVWDCDPHTAAKLAILKNYLEAWFPILTRQAAILNRNGSVSNREILFVDGFAGPGEYKNGFFGSPKISLETAINHSVKFPFPLRMLFIEKCEDRFNHLKKVIKPLIEEAQSVPNLIVSPPENDDCGTVLNCKLETCAKDGNDFGPAMVFLDQFGYATRILVSSC